MIISPIKSTSLRWHLFEYSLVTFLYTSSHHYVIFPVIFTLDLCSLNVFTIIQENMWQLHRTVSIIKGRDLLQTTNLSNSQVYELQS